MMEPLRIEMFSCSVTEAVQHYRQTLPRFDGWVLRDRCTDALFATAPEARGALEQTILDCVCMGMIGVATLRIIRISDGRYEVRDELPGAEELEAHLYEVRAEPGILIVSDTVPRSAEWRHRVWELALEPIGTVMPHLVTDTTEGQRPTPPSESVGTVARRLARNGWLVLRSEPPSEACELSSSALTLPRLRNYRESDADLGWFGSIDLLRELRTMHVKSGDLEVDISNAALRLMSRGYLTGHAVIYVAEQVTDGQSSMTLSASSRDADFALIVELSPGEFGMTWVRGGEERPVRYVWYLALGPDGPHIPDVSPTLDPDESMSEVLDFLERMGWFIRDGERNGERVYKISPALDQLRRRRERPERDED